MLGTFLVVFIKDTLRVDKCFKASEQVDMAYLIREHRKQEMCDGIKACQHELLLHEEVHEGIKACLLKLLVHGGKT